MKGYVAHKGNRWYAVVRTEELVVPSKRIVLADSTGVCALHKPGTDTSRLCGSRRLPACAATSS